MKQVKWFEREFIFPSDQNIFPLIIERLWGTPARLEEKVLAMPDDILTAKFNGKWTIKENVGHLTDLESLWQGRLQDIINNEIELRPTDLQNTKTSLANHDSMPIKQLLENFRKIRTQTVQLIEKLNKEQIFKSALHPRLKTPMRTMDLFLFVAEHDDHHLATITELARMSNYNTE